EEYGGRIVKVTGDGLLLEFSSVVDAVQCCLDVQLGMLERNNETPLERRIQFRVGINLGDIIIDDDDIFGNGVNIAARLEAMSDPGGICISQAVLDQIKGKLALNIEDLGDRALKNIEEPVHAYRIVHNVQTEFDAAATNKAEGSLDTHPPLPKRPSIAIMPFRNANGDPKVDYIADGIGLGIQSLLVQLSGLFLVNANAHQSYRDGKTTAAEAVKELPIQYVLEGAVQQADRHVRVTV
ncbi:MAG TPA: adenylate/guanylate cyclase domain-containing protein, partial [Kiloniellaceae bacterium]|nr:adenylate/guanylate cyclase domain-containing protein [Kiloniellaceae bacterium]